MDQEVRIAYIILAHKNFRQLKRLISRLENNHAHFFIHISKTSEKTFFRQTQIFLNKKDNCQLIIRERVRWGDFGIVQAALNGIKAICDHQKTFDFAVLLSGQDYPLKSNCEINSILSQKKGKQILEIFPLPRNDWGHKGGLERLKKYYFWIGSNMYRFPPTSTQSSFFKRFIDPIGQFLWKVHSLPKSIAPYGGSFWWCLSKDCITYINRYVHSKDGIRLVKFFRHTLHPSEMFFQTIIMNSHLKGSALHHNMRFVEFPKGNGHPKTLTKEDKNRLLASNCLFARKFDLELDAQIFDIIDQYIEEKK
jgi:hypothetical protein